MNTPLSPSDLLPCAVAAARASGDFARAHRDRSCEVSSFLKHDIKLQLDSDCQRVAEQEILRRHPGHAILGEEGSSPAPGAEFEWIVDPIDGTMNFFHGLPHWCASVAVRRPGGPILAGCVFAPDLQECYTAAEGVPSTRNDKPIRVSPVATLDRAMLLTGLGKPPEGETYDVRAFNYLIKSAQKTRVLGAAALDICFVACGRVEAYVDAGISLWDYAAAEIIARQAGGRAAAIALLPDGRARYLASNGLVHEAARALLDFTVNGTGSCPAG